jgi:hypothetical protein
MGCLCFAHRSRYDRGYATFLNHESNDCFSKCSGSELLGLLKSFLTTFSPDLYYYQWCTLRTSQYCMNCHQNMSQVGSLWPIQNARLMMLFLHVTLTNVKLKHGISSVQSWNLLLISLIMSVMFVDYLTNVRMWAKRDMCKIIPVFNGGIKWEKFKCQLYVLFYHEYITPWIYNWEMPIFRFKLDVIP